MKTEQEIKTKILTIESQIIQTKKGINESEYPNLELMDLLNDLIVKKKELRWVLQK